MISKIYESIIPLDKIGDRKGKSKTKLEADFDKNLNSMKSSIPKSRKVYKSKIQTLDLNCPKLKKWKKKRKIK
jgi:hypothetical protein